MAIWEKILKIINRKKIKHKFKLVIKLIANEYYIDLFYYLFYSFFVALSGSVNFT